MDAHELISQLKEMAISLGRPPTKNEFCSSVVGGWNRVVRFGGWTSLVLAAGLEPYTGKSRRVTNEIFRADVSAVLDAYTPIPSVQSAWTKTTIIPDTHFPFVSQRVLDAIYKRIQEFKPIRVIQLGDLYDMYAHSKFPKSLNIYTPNQEEDLARRGAEEMWKTIRGIVPKAECVQLKGNHDNRAVKRVLEVSPALERAVEKHVNDLMRFEGVTLIEDSRQEYFFDGVQVIHGHYSGIGKHRDYALMNCIRGHGHKAGISYRRFRGQTFFEMDPGLAGDPESKALGYTSQKTFDATPGFGELDELGPRVILV